MTGMSKARAAPTLGQQAINLQLVGGFTLDRSGQVAELPESSRRLVAFLGLAERPCQPTLVAAALWPDRPEHRALANLRQARWKLTSYAGDDVVQSCGGVLSLSCAVRTDLDELSALGRMIAVRPDALPDLRCASAFLLELLPGWYEDWIIIERERIRQIHRRYAEAAIRELLSRGCTTDALDLALRLVADDPFQESAQRVLLTVYCAEGNFAEACRHLQRFNNMLLQELGVTSTLTIEELCGTFGHRPTAGA